MQTGAQLLHIKVKKKQSNRYFRCKKEVLKVIAKATRGVVGSSAKRDRRLRHGCQLST
jgi:hypothetical protein